jgi:hypothetical protein
LKRQQQAFREAETRLAAALALRHGRLAHTFGELRSEQQEQDDAEGAGAGGGDGKGRSEWMPLLAASSSSSSSSGKTLLLQHHGSSSSSSSSSSSPPQPQSHPSRLSHPNAALALPTRRFQIDWSLAPRTVCIRLDCLRALKNKVPGGRYVMLVTLHDRLGGSPLRWSRLHGIRWSGSTPHPQRHGGRFGDTDLSFAQKRNRVFVALPAEAHTRPSMCLVFELFLCRGRHSKTDRVVAWGAFPICTGAGDGSLIAGTFKTPLLRGPVDARVCKFEQMERAISDDLDQWLCNLYFSVRHLPRYASGEKEYTVELSVTSNVLRLRYGSVHSAEDAGNYSL